MTMHASDYDAIDEVLRVLGDNGVDVRGRLIPNHAPMAAEALCALGAPDAAVALAEKRRGDVLGLPPPLSPISLNEWGAALGDRTRLMDWLLVFRNALRRESWRDVVATWVPRLAPGLEAGGTHALIRTGHAVRAVEELATPLRLEEMAKALAYWASEFDPLPGTPQLDGYLSIAQAARSVPRLDASVPRAGAPREFVHVVERLDGFGPAVEAARGPGSAETALDDILDLGLHLYLANAHRQPLVCLHAVTGPAALALLLPHLHPNDRRPAVACVWQAVAATIGAYVESWEIPPETSSASAIGVDDLVAHAIRSDDVHVIKFTEACVRLARAGRPAFLRAALDWRDRVDRSRTWSADEKRRAGMYFG